MRRLKFEAVAMTEGEILVRGTHDPHEALKVVFEQMDNSGEFHALDSALVEVDQSNHADDYAPDRAAVAEFGDRLHGMLQDARAGYYRKINVLPTMYGADEGWGWMLYPARQGRPGAFPAVEFPR